MGLIRKFRDGDSFNERKQQYEQDLEDVAASIDELIAKIVRINEYKEIMAFDAGRIQAELLRIKYKLSKLNSDQNSRNSD